MTIREIPTSQGLPPLRLPAGALSSQDREHSIDPVQDQPAIEPIEHKLRVDFMQAGPPDNLKQLLDSYVHYQSGPGDEDPWSEAGVGEKPLALQYAETTIEKQWESEQRFFENFESDDVLADAPAYLANALRECRSKSNPEQAVQQERENRAKWYRLMPWKNLYAVFKRSTLGDLSRPLIQNPTPGAGYGGSNSSETRYVGVLVIPSDANVDTVADEYGVNPTYVRRESEFETHHSSSAEMPVPSDYGIELPAPLLLGDYPGQSEYLFIPWSSGLVCQGPFKQEHAYRVTCKHEVFASFVLREEGSVFLPVDEGISVPARARRFIDPQVAVNHSPEQ
ncbi:hypothetical protein [Haloarcula sp. H-GB5]